MVTPSIAFRAEPDRHDLKISPSNFGKRTRGGFTCSAADVKLAVCFGFTAGPFPFSFKKIPAWLRVSNTSLDNSCHSRSVASSASPSGSASSNAT
ncbi:hypothetical protein T12_7030 [Trichinella patagoniensis]|uniref:Uncharacterized protein n=1 Tax=Trichinella patagoniensis TaxID=990121 RepID=A0A0V0ZE28_9BILA|nr:hypothetical protein T12_11818 [Trichinella patagoniensis]KRY10667.1 hypothetical protein T12_7030 [Trichinella patagoniensis]